MVSPGVRLADHPCRVSRLSVTAFVVVFMAGIAAGAAAYGHRSPGIERHVAGTNAITVHVVLAAVAAAAVIGIQVGRSRRPAGPGASPWTAPFAASAVSRLRATVRPSSGLALASAARIVAAMPLVALLLYVPFRMGAQIVGGLDPNVTVNAWGGPTYVGALLAHWLDAIVVFYGAAFLLSRVLVPAAAGRAGRSGTREHRTGSVVRGS